MHQMQKEIFSLHFSLFYLYSLLQTKASNLQTNQQIWGGDVKRRLRRLLGKQIPQQQDSFVFKAKI